MTWFYKKSQWYEYSELGILNTSKRYTWKEFTKWISKYKIHMDKLAHDPELDIMFGCRWLQPGNKWFAVPALQMEMIQQARIDSGEITEHDFVLDYFIPTEQIKFNGEISNSNCMGGIYIYGSTLPNLPMRPALAQGGRNISRLELRQVIGDVQYEKIMDLVDAYEEQVIEFSCFGNSVGRFSEELIIWEIRGSY